jgi:polysaccharide transporter, PST family
VPLSLWAPFNLPINSGSRSSADQPINLLVSKYFEDNQAQAGLGRQSLRSGAISVVSRGANIVVQIGSSICLARLLTPEDFGLVAMVSAITGFAPVLIDLGTRDAAVQRERITQDEVSALFWLTFGIGAILACLLVICSPLIARFYHEPQLERIALFSALTFIFSALSCQHFALLRRAMMFQQIAGIEVGGNLLGACVSVVMAFTGWGYWALVARPIITALFILTGVWWSCRWWPGWPRFTTGVKEMLKFGLNVTGFTMTDYVGRAADRVALGYMSGSRELGYYQNAFLVYDNPLGVVTMPLHVVAVSSLSKLRSDPEQLRKSWATALSSLAFFAMPMFSILAVTGQDFVVLLLGSKWLYAGAIVSVLALRGPAHVVERSMGWLHVAADRSDRWLRWGLVGCGAQLAALACGLPFGALGIATAYVISTYVLFVPAIAYAGQPLGIGAKDVVRTIGPQMAAALAAAALGFLLRYRLLADVSMWTRIALLLPACLAAYAMVAVGLFRVTKPLGVAHSLFIGFLPAKIPFLRCAGPRPAPPPNP